MTKERKYIARSTGTLNSHIQLAMKYIHSYSKEIQSIEKFKKILKENETLPFSYVVCR